MPKNFIECTDAIMSCLSEHDLITLQAIYAPRLAEASREKEQHHEHGKPSGLVERMRFYEAICEALAVEQARR